ncbi:unnamed protein product [Cuscuta epithymum]|uniref:Uncharacterized protein n=1 Tax=Cuscuta epithymum TaxID=186058 RepID=A0AAV0GD43_9ASTE|nr:unnamed protein product [Cuscuta epithymum]
MAIGAEEEELDLNKIDVEVVGDERRARPPPESPSWSANKSRVWKKMGEFYFNFVLFSLCFFIELHVVLDMFFFPSRDILEFRLCDEKSGLQVIGSVKSITGPTNVIVSTEVIDSQSGSRADCKHEAFYRFVYFFSLIVYQPCDERYFELIY